MGALSTEMDHGWWGAGELSSAWREHPVMRAIGLAGLVVGVTAAGLLVGRELRIRYKFNRRTPTDFFSKAGDSLSGTEYGMGT